MIAPERVENVWGNPVGMRKKTKSCAFVAKTRNSVKWRAVRFARDGFTFGAWDTRRTSGESKLCLLFLHGLEDCVADERNRAVE